MICELLIRIRRGSYVRVASCYWRVVGTTSSLGSEIWLAIAVTMWYACRGVEESGCKSDIHIYQSLWLLVQKLMSLFILPSSDTEDRMLASYAIELLKSSTKTQLNTMQSFTAPATSVAFLGRVLRRRAPPYRLCLALEPSHA